MIHLGIGRRQLGKTTLVYSMALKVPARILLDPRGMIHTPSTLRVYDTDTFMRAIDLLHQEQSGVREIVWTPRGDLAMALDTASTEVTRWWETFPDRRLMFVVDEARFFHNLATSQPFDYVLRASPQTSIDVAITAHRPKDIPTDIRAISDFWLLFKHTQNHDLTVIEERCGIAVRNAVAKLERFQFISWDDGTATATAYRQPGAWFVPLQDGRAANPVPLLDPGDTIDLVDKGKLF